MVGAALVPAQRPALGPALGRDGELPRPAARPGVPQVGPKHRRVHAALRADLGRARAGRRRRAERAHPLHLDLPHGRLHPGRRVHRCDGDHLQLGGRPDVRDRQLAAERGRHLVAGVLPRPRPGALRHRRHDRVGLGRLRRDHLPGGAAGHPAGAARGGRDRRRVALVDVPLGRAAAARPGDALPGRLVDDQRPAALRRDLQHHPRRAAAVDDGVVYYLWQQAFQFFEAGYGAAIAYVLFVAILVVTLIQLLVSRRTVHYTS